MSERPHWETVHPYSSLAIDRSGWIVNTSELCEVLACDRKALTRWNRAGMPKLGRGRWQLVECVRWLIEYVSEQGESSETVDQARMQLLQVQTERATLELGELRGELIPIDDVDFALQRIATIVSGGLDALPARAAAVVPGLAPAAVEDELDRECAAIRESIADALERFAVEGAEDLDALPAPAPEEPGRVGRREPDPPA